MGNTYIMCPAQHDKVMDPDATAADEEKDSKDSKYFIEKEYVNILVKSWQDCKKIGVIKIGALTFKTVFAQSPEAFELFSFASDPKWETSHHFEHHCKVFVNVIGNAIETLTKPDLLLHRLGFLGYIHKMRETTQEQFDFVEEIFLNSLETCLAENWSPKHREAWKALYKAMAVEMLRE